LEAPSSATKAVAYRCPACGCPLILRAGEVKAHHFAHKPNANCSPETVLHRTAKLMICAYISNWKSRSAPAPMIARSCPRCGSDHPQSVPATVHAAVMEHRLESGRVVDVALHDSAGNILAALEVLVSHAVDEPKAASIANVPWIEVKAENVIESPSRWVPVQDHFKPIRCAECNAHRAKLASVARASGSALAPSPPYEAAVYDCYKCKAEMLIYRWTPEGGVEDDELWPTLPPPEPVPPSVQWRFSKQLGRKYWANVCPRCNAIQGGFYLRWDAAFHQRR